MKKRCLLNRRSLQRERLSASVLSICSSVRLPVCLSPKCKKRDFLKKTKQFRAMVFLSRVSILTRDIDIANLSVCLSVCPSVRLPVRNVPVSDENGLTYCQGYVPLTLDVVRVAFKVPLALHTPL